LKILAPEKPVKTFNKLKSWLTDESGATAIEYGLIAGGMALALVPAMASLGSGVINGYANIGSLFDF
jgi:pilus assembly protein Flp/PilA